MKEIKIFFESNNLNNQELINKIDLNKFILTIRNKEVFDLLWNCKEGDKFEFTKEFGFPDEIIFGNNIMVVKMLINKPFKIETNNFLIIKKIFFETI